MIRVRWTRPALQDLEGISLYLEGANGLDRANRVCLAIYDAVHFLRRFPESGKGGVEETTREWVVPSQPSYVIVYRIRHSEAVEILRIWHGAQLRF